MRWEVVTEVLKPDRLLRLVLRQDARPLPVAAVLELWHGDTAFRDFFNRVLAEVPFAAYFWETPPLSRASIERPFECVLVDSPALAAVAPDPGAFAEHFAGPGAAAPVVAFTSLGGDAWLVVPCPRGPPVAYTHLAAFVRHAPQSQRQALWRMTGTAVSRRLSERPLWLSTAGLGVYWLHVRLDSRPKYYSYRPYTRLADG
jgi:hypothetical protein